MEIFTIDAAARVLSKTLRREVRLGDVVCLSDDDRRNQLLRLRDLSGGSPANFIVKKVVAESYVPSDCTSWDTRRFLSDLAGAEFLSTVLSTPLSPHFYGGSHELGFFILEDLGEHRSLVEPLLEEDAASAECALLAFSSCLGTMHAGTAGHSTTYERLLRARCPHVGIFASPLMGLGERVNELQARLDGLGIDTGTDYTREVHSVITAIEHPGPFLSYVHGDPCPDNVFWTGNELRLIDFEFGGFGHALADASYGRMLFPSCWCANRLPEALISKMEAAYRTELVKGCHEAQDDRTFENALATACAFWLLNTLSRQLDKAMDADRTWGIATIRQRVLARLEAFTRTAEAFDRLSALRDAASRLLETLQAAWPDTPRLPVYPSFSGLKTD